MGLYKCLYLDTDERCKWHGNYCKYYKSVSKCEVYSKKFGEIADCKRQLYQTYEDVKNKLSLNQMIRIISIMEE